MFLNLKIEGKRKGATGSLHENEGNCKKFGCGREQREEDTSCLLVSFFPPKCAAGLPADREGWERFEESRERCKGVLLENWSLSIPETCVVSQCWASMEMVTVTLVLAQAAVGWLASSKAQSWDCGHSGARPPCSSG